MDRNILFRCDIIVEIMFFFGFKTPKATRMDQKETSIAKLL